MGASKLAWQKKMVRQRYQGGTVRKRGKRNPVWELQWGENYIASVACTSSPKFKEDDIAKTETDIRTNFEQHGFIVEQVSLIKESDRRLSGFVKFRKSSGLFSKAQLMKNCTATMGVDSAQYIWECK